MSNQASKATLNKQVLEFNVAQQLRCLAPVSVAVSMEIEETFTPRVDIVTGGKLSQSPDVDATTLISEQHILDLTEVVRQSLYLAQPAQILCKEDCLGLCPQCGKNRNQVQCNCTEETIDSRWADLFVSP
ncbi:MAG: hypothetical protein B6243_12445 [Anaerolineaceae bacterium 4572_5.2]|nr:MAG: hypothetical protein B6243_12445 [Anaerolineaceae bacterium 4572_5.2]